MKCPSAVSVVVDDTLSDLSQSEQFIHACAYHTESQQTTSIETWVRPAVKISFLVAHNQEGKSTSGQVLHFMHVPAHLSAPANHRNDHRRFSTGI